MNLYFVFLAPFSFGWFDGGSWTKWCDFLLSNHISKRKPLEPVEAKRIVLTLQQFLVLFEPMLNGPCERKVGWKSCRCTTFHPEKWWYEESRAGELEMGSSPSSSSKEKKRRNFRSRSNWKDHIIQTQRRGSCSSSAIISKRLVFDKSWKLGLLLSSSSNVIIIIIGSNIAWKYGKS